MIRHNGDLFLAADRKNRVERARLDKQLKCLDKDLARHEFFIDRQKKNLVTKWRGVSMTTGHSDKALPPDGPHDNAYEKSKYNNHRLSEKRLMEWKVHERQLEKFLRQFEPRPCTCPSKVKPRPSSSCSERAPSRAGERENWTKSKMAGRGRVQSARAVLQRDGSLCQKRSSSVVSFSSRTEIISHGKDMDRLSEAEEESAPGGALKVWYDTMSQGPLGMHAIHSGVRSLSATAIHHPHSDQDIIRRGSPSPKLRFCEEMIGQDSYAKPPVGTTLSASQATQRLQANERAQSAADVKFFVTKDNVVMTNAVQHTCRKFSVADGSGEGLDVAAEGGESQGASVLRATTASNADRMSVRSLSSDDLTDSVFLGEDVTAPHHCQPEGTGSTATKGKTSSASEFSDVALQEPPAGECDKTDVKLSHQRGEADEETVSKVSDMVSNTDKLAVNESAGHQVQTVKKLAVVDSHRSSAGTGSAGTSGRRHSSHPLPQHRPVSTDSRRHSMHARKDNANLSPKALLAKRQQGSAVPHSNTPSSARMNSSIVSAMTVTPLLTKGSIQQASGVSHTQTAASKARQQQNRPSIPRDSNQANMPRDFPPSRHYNNMSDDEDDEDEEIASNVEERQPSQWRRDLALEQPTGLSPSVSSLGTVIKAAMVFSKASRRRALSTMVEENNVDTREVIRKERLRKLQSRNSVLTKIMSQFGGPGGE